MNLHGKDIKIFSANANPAVAEHIAKVLGLAHGQMRCFPFFRR